MLVVYPVVEARPLWRFAARRAISDLSHETEPAWWRALRASAPDDAALSLL